VEVQAVGVARLQGVDAKVLLGDQGEDGVDLIHGASFRDVVGVT
jgi:hypothetical protein